jgi:UDPglucose 6-dehydrogenase
MIRAVRSSVDKALCLPGQALKHGRFTLQRMKPLDTGSRIAFVGLGYVGLSTAVCLASRGFMVHGIDIDEKKLEGLRRGAEPFHEKGLMPLLRTSLRRRTLELSSSFDKLKDSKVIFITVGTPSREDGSIDTSYVEASAKEIGRQLASAEGFPVVVVKSTVVPGTTTGLVLPILEKESGKKAGVDFGLAANPEFLHEGSAIEETFHPDALLVGGHDKKSTDALMRLYRRFYRELPPTIRTTPSNAEMMKYAINGGRAVQVSFINTIANLCSKIPGCNMEDVRRGLAAVARMDQRYLSAGLGFGGSCLPKDGRALAAFARSMDVDNQLISAALNINERQAAEAIEIAEGLSGSVAGKKVSILGLAFKANTDDVRESVSIHLTQSLLSRKAVVTVYDPRAMGNAKLVLGDRVQYAKNARDCLSGSECCFIATGWDEFKRLRPSEFKSLMAFPVVVDGRRIYDQRPFRKEGILIGTIGTGP